MAFGPYQLVLRNLHPARLVAGYRPDDDRFAYLFNSYYEDEGDRHPRPTAGDVSRPSLDDICAVAITSTMRCEGFASLAAAHARLVELGINHEQQHQELFLTDILATSPRTRCFPIYGDVAPSHAVRSSR